MAGVKRRNLGWYRSIVPTVMLVGLATAAGQAQTAEPRPRVVQPGAPGEASRAVTPEQASRVATAAHSEADVRFMRDMIVHHAQALEMAELATTRTSRADVRLLAQRIDLAQRDEIAMMRHWLEARGHEAPRTDSAAAGGHAHHGHAHHGAAHEHADMPGMLSPAELARLAASRDAEFDRLFLEFMIHHHEGALAMVAELFAAPGGGQESEIFQLASHIDGDQRIEIARMYRMLAAGR
jgi:uncharacterized protein (DUF305 family)